MPTVKIGDLGKPCGHPEHDPPKHVVWPGGVYRHTCPACKAVQVFTVDKVQYTVSLWAA